MDVLFLCPHGGAKSVIAAALFNRIAFPLVSSAAAADDPYDAVPEQVARWLELEGLRAPVVQPQRVEAADLQSAGHIIAIGCDPGAAGAERWDGVPMASEDLQVCVADIRVRVEELAARLKAAC